MYEMIFDYALLGLAMVNMAALSCIVYKEAQKKSQTKRGVERTPRSRKRKNPDIELFKKINPYLQGLTYAYSAYRLANQIRDPVAYVATCMAGGQLYVEYKSAQLRSKKK